MNWIAASLSGGEPLDGLTVEEIPANTRMIFSGTGSMPDA